MTTGLEDVLKRLETTIELIERLPEDDLTERVGLCYQLAHKAEEPLQELQARYARCLDRIHKLQHRISQDKPIRELHTMVQNKALSRDGVREARKAHTAILNNPSRYSKEGIELTRLEIESRIKALEIKHGFDSDQTIRVSPPRIMRKSQSERRPS